MIAAVPGAFRAPFLPWRGLHLRQGLAAENPPPQRSYE
jgi:hypothetical protein